MRKKLTGIFCAVVLGGLSFRAWAQPPTIMPDAKPLPPPIEAGQPKESPPPTVGNGVFPEIPTTPGVPPGVIGPAEGCNNCEPQQQRNAWSGVFGGAIGGEYLFPMFGSNPAFFTTSTAGGKTLNNQQNFGTTGNGAPTAFVNYTLDSGLGVQSNWFSFHTSNSQNATLNGTSALQDAGGTAFGTPSTGSTANAYSQLDMLVINIEITQKWVIGNCWWLKLGGGVEYAHISESYALNLIDKVNGNSSSIANHGFTGWGPTVSFEFHRRLCESDFGVYGTTRGTLLFGTETQNYQFNSPGVGVAGAVVTPTSTTGLSNSNLVVPVGEMELGVEWGHNWGKLKAFAQIGVTGQIWFGGGNSSQGAGLGGTFANQTSSPANFGLIGGVARIGFEF